MTRLVLVLASAFVMALLFALPGFVRSPYALHVMILLFLGVSQGQSWNILGG